MKNRTAIAVFHTACPERQASVGPGSAKSCGGGGGGAPGGVGGPGHICKLTGRHMFT